MVMLPSSQKALLHDMHSKHLGIDKMKSLTRLTWWPNIGAHLRRIEGLPGPSAKIPRQATTEDPVPNV